MKIQSFFLLLLGACLMTSCEKDIEFTGDETTPLLVLNCVAVPEKALTVEVSKSLFFLDNDNHSTTLNNATVKLYVNHEFRETLSARMDGKFVSNYQAQLGDVLQLEASAPGFAKVLSTTVVELPTEVMSVDTTYYHPTYSYDYNSGSKLEFEAVLKIKIHNPTPGVDYYKAYTSIINSDGTVYSYVAIPVALSPPFGESEMDNTLIYANEVLFSDEVSVDKDFEITLHISYSRQYTPGEKLTIQLDKLHGDLYKYLFTARAQGNSIELFSEPIQVYSNVTDGTGIFGSYTPMGNSLTLPLDYIRAQASDVY